MHSFEVHSNESACRKSGRLGLDQVIYHYFRIPTHAKKIVRTREGTSNVLLKPNLILP